MESLLFILPYLIGIFAGVTALVLFGGLFAFMGDTKTHDAYSNLFMRWRVGLQGVTLALLALYFLLGGQP